MQHDGEIMTLKKYLEFNIVRGDTDNTNISKFSGIPLTSYYAVKYCVENGMCDGMNVKIYKNKHGKKTLILKEIHKTN